MINDSKVSGRGHSASCTILIVEDHDTVRKSLVSWFAVVLPRCDVLEAPSGEEALGIIREVPVDLVVMDINLPGLNGIEVTEKIKSLRKEVRILILTIHEEERYVDDARAAGADAYVTKSSMQSALLPEVERLVFSIVDGRRL